MSRADIDVCICSYKRAEIADTIRAVGAQAGLDEVKIRLIVADNTATGEMREIASCAAAEAKLHLCYIHAPASNISIARNACVDAAEAEWIAFLDDDEIPCEGWLRALLDEAARGRWDAVLGPVRAIYPDAVPRWTLAGDFHSVRPVWVRGIIRTAYTGNVLFRRALALRAGLRFRIELGRSGGEDEDFFYRFADAGGRIGYAAGAAVFERVPRDRVSLRWLVRRNFRAGQSHGARLERRKLWSVYVLVASLKASFCALGAVVCSAHAVRRTRFLVRAALHVGVVARLTGVALIDIY